MTDKNTSTGAKLDNEQMTQLDSAASEIRDLLRRRNEEIDECAKAIDLADEGLATAAKDYDDAVEAADLQKFEQAKLDKEFFTRRKELYEARMDKLKHQPYISQDEYDSLRKAVQDAYSAEENRQRVRVNALANQLYSIAESLRAEEIKANRAMETLIDDIYRDAEHGNPKAVITRRTAHWAACGVRDPEYKAENGEQVQKEKLQKIGVAAGAPVNPWIKH